MLQEKKIYHVQFYDTVDGRTDYFFRTVTTMFTRFTPEQIGCSLATMQNHPPKPGEPRTTKKCIIYVRCLIVKSK